MARSTLDTIIGVALIVIGILLCLGKLGLGGLLPFAGIVLIVLGVLILINTLPGGTLVGIVCLVIGIILAAGFLSLPNEVRDIMWIVNIVAGVILIIVGAKRLMR